MSAPARTLPLRVPPVPGEALDSWLEALARRHQVTVGMLVTALGWRMPGSPGGLVAGIPAQVLRRLEHQAGLPAGRLDGAVLDRYLPLAAARRRGSRYCPSCLAERDGRWLLAWRLGWIFACTAHGVLLCDACPACGQAPRSRTGRASGLNPPGTCANTIKRHEHCGADLREVTPQRLDPDHPVLAAQRWTGTLLTLDDTRPAGNGDALSDLGTVASWVLRQPPAAQFAGSGPAALAAWREQDQQPPAARRQPSRFPPASAALTAALAATAMTVLAGSDEQAIEQIRALLPPRAGPRRPRPAGLPAARWRQLSAPARSRFLRALDPDLSPADRIRYRTGTPQAAIPDDPPGLLAARARAIPQLLWPDWAIRLMPARGFAPGPFRSAIAACLLLPGHPGRAISTAITALHAYRSALATGAVLRALAGGGHDAVLTAISCLAGYLDTGGSPIDYQRRRDLIPAETITAGQWRQLCFGAAAHPGEARRHRDAQRYLFQLLTGADLHDPRHALAFTSNYDYSRYHAFAGTLPTGLRDALHPPRRRSPARPGHRRAADLVTAARLLRRPGPTRTRPGRHRPGRHRAPHHHPEASRHRGRRPAGHHRRPRPARAGPRPPARTAVGPVRRAPDMAAATACPRHLDPRVLRPRVHHRGQEPAAAGSRHRDPLPVPHPGRP